MTVTRASWPPDFSKKRRLKIMAEQRHAFLSVRWDREDSEGGEVVWTAQTDKGETLIISYDSISYQTAYQVWDIRENDLMKDEDLGEHMSFLHAQQALADYTIDYWGSYQAWEEQAQTEMLEDEGM